MSDAVLEWRRYRYFPYERDFGRLEATALFGVAPREDEGGLRIPISHYSPTFAKKLTYFSRVVPPAGPAVVPRQVLLEASATAPKHEKQSTRYSSHGLHEYKGKFNPQVVRAVGNMLKLADDAVVLDPFSGSGTTMLECAHAGWSGVGVDRNPLAVLIANAKVRALRRADGRLQELASVVAASLAESARLLSKAQAVGAAELSKMLGAGWLSELVHAEYLEGWFPLPVLAQAVAILRVLKMSIDDAADRSIFETILSDQLRDVSLQEPADLRIRRRKDPQPNYRLIHSFLEAMHDQVGRVARAREALGRIKGRHCALLGDVRSDLTRSLRRHAPRGYDAVITSPPYATALPYIDTQRLSMVLLNLIAANEILSTEKALIGAREISGTERTMLECQIESNPTILPQSVNALCRDLARAARGPGNGFRRRNQPALVFRYFRDMAAFFANVRAVMKPGAPVALVVGKNRTTLGGTEFLIDTPSLLADVACHLGYSRIHTERMDTYPRYELHQKNAIDEETLIVVSVP